MRTSRLGSMLLVALLLAAAAPVSAVHPPGATGRGGAVACAAPAAATAGREVLELGGNAADAAVATALALAVVHPQAGNLGGGGFAVVRIGGQVETLDFRETAPAAATHDMFLDAEGEPVRERSLVGPLAAGVPGSPDGLYRLHERHGALPWAAVVAPAIRLASEGFVVTERLSTEIAESRALLARFPETAAVWLPDAAPPAPGSVMVQPALAASLRAYAQHGPSALTDGPAAAAVEAVSRRYGGVLRASDLAAYRAVWRRPVRVEAYGWQIAAMGLPSSGGIIMGQTLGLLERLGWAKQPRHGAERAHQLVESWRRAYADRFLLGDPRTTLATATQLLDRRWLDRRAREVGPRASPSAQVRPRPRQPRPESRETTHLSVIDAAGGAVSLTTTLNGRFGSGVLVPGAGFLLNNEMDDFATAPGRPNLYGLVQGEANAVGAGKRMLSSMSPVIAWRDPEVLVLGSPGGSRIPTSTLQVLLNVVVDGDHLQAAVDRPRLHHQWLPDEIVAEADALAPETEAALVARGHAVRTVAPFGEVHAVRRLTDGRVVAAHDPRGPGAAEVQACAVAVAVAR